MFPLESPHHFQYKKENHPKSSQICRYEILSKGLENEFETAVVNKPSVFEPLNVYCIILYTLQVSVHLQGK